MDRIKIIYKKDKSEVINNIRDYIGKEGVWALFGTRDEGIFRCLNVGKNVNVGGEISYDVKCMDNIIFREDGNREYINQFAEDCGFKYGKKTQEYLYPYINLKYNTIMFVYIHNESDLKIEKEFAWLTHAKFWRNGRPFKTSRDEFCEHNREAVLKTKRTITTIKNCKELEKSLKDLVI